MVEVDVNNNELGQPSTVDQYETSSLPSASSPALHAKISAGKVERFDDGQNPEFSFYGGQVREK